MQCYVQSLLINQDLRGARFKLALACGSMVLHDSMLFVFALAERKNEQRKR
jgi:hypothetical protein